MPPIELFKNSAINANAITPQTASPEQATSTSTFPTPTSHAAQSYPVARPGAAAIPAPTAAVDGFAPTAVQPTPTSTQQAFPPAPQPGAVPLPLNPLAMPRSNIPPPPKAGEANIPPFRTTPSLQHPPQQMYMPPPTTTYRAQPPASSTSTATVPSSSYPMSLPTSQYENGPQSLQGPAGYHQNPYASDLTPEQRRAQDARGDEDSEDTSGTTSLGEDASNVWNTAMQWAQKAGEKISEAESEVKEISRSSSGVQSSTSMGMTLSPSSQPQFDLSGESSAQMYDNSLSLRSSLQRSI